MKLNILHGGGGTGVEKHLTPLGFRFSDLWLKLDLLTTLFTSVIRASLPGANLLGFRFQGP